MQCRWSSYKDKDFTMDLGKDFYHEDMISREGWAKYYFKGKYDRDCAYVQLRIVNPQTGQYIHTYRFQFRKSYQTSLDARYYVTDKGKYDRDCAYVQLRIVNPQTGQYIHTYRFQFRKSYQTSLDARYYVTDPILGDKIVKNGVLIELQPRKQRDGKVIYRRGKTTFKQLKIKSVLTGSHKKETVDTNAIIQTSVRYSEKPKMIFLVTPPHLMKYAKLILILVKQLVDLNFDKSYMTKSKVYDNIFNAKLSYGLSVVKSSSRP